MSVWGPLHPASGEISVNYDYNVNDDDTVDPVNLAGIEVAATATVLQRLGGDC